MPVCDNCDKEVDKVYRSLGGLSFCHACAHHFGLSHKHPTIENTFHGVGMGKRDLKKHLKEIAE